MICSPMNNPFRGVKVPEIGGCVRCNGGGLPINRMKLCYTCWVEVNLESCGWKRGQPHPLWCHCDACEKTRGLN